jgi:hypothetical protein
MRSNRSAMLTFVVLACLIEFVIFQNCTPQSHPALKNNHETK